MSESSVKKRIIAMIPARLGSKRIPKKNIRYLFDKPLVMYPIDLCLQSDLFETIWINTESVELGRLAEARGVRFHKRPEELVKETATNREFTYEFLKEHECDYVVMVNTTSPLLRASTLRSFVEYVLNNDYDTILSVIEEKEEAFFRNEPVNFSLEKKINNQLLEPIELIVWALTAWKRDTFIRLNEMGISPVFGGKLGKFKIPKDEACDLDTEDDWRIAEGFLASRSVNTNKRYLKL
jgi:CMP-N-acetylneuraminic acid synthetase